MLYITTNDRKDAHTAYKTLVSDCAADGGVYIPFRFPKYDEIQLHQLMEMSFSDVVAQVLNTFFSAQLTAWDVDFAIGRSPLKLATVGRKIVVSELWHNHSGSYDCLERNLFKKLSANSGIAADPTDWARIAIRIAVLFGIYGQMHKDGTVAWYDTPDVVMEAGNYFEPIAAYYAKIMGLPMGKIIVCCNNETALLWDLIQRNTVSTSALSQELTLGIARLLYGVYGSEELDRFIQASGAKRTYAPDDAQAERLADTFFCVVVSTDRLASLVNGVLKTDDYRIDEKTAMSFGAVQDYRAKAGESNLTLVFSENKPN